MTVNRLGRGLEALIRPVDELEKGASPGVLEIPLASIIPNPHQPRQEFDEETMGELADSIREKGVLTPITVQLKDGQYILIAGERRYRASKMVGLTTIPGYVVHVKSDADIMEMALVENIQRENLNAIEEAEAYAFLNSQFNLTQEKIAKAVGKKRVTISNSLRLLNLPTEIRQSLRKGEISAGHGRAILMLKTPREQLKLWAVINRQGLSVRQAEELAAAAKTVNATAPKGRRVNPTIQSLENELISLLGTKVRVKARAGKGSIEIFWFSEDDLERLLELLRSLN